MQADTTLSVPSPFSFDTSQHWDGNDGKWSTFSIRVGTPEQDFRVLPALATGEALIPAPDGCANSKYADCALNRGVYPFDGQQGQGFQVNRSSTWRQIGLSGLDLRADLNETGKGVYGLENLGLLLQSSGGPSLKNQVIGAVTTEKPRIGIVGLDVKPSNFTELEHPQRVLLPTLKDEGLIPSLSYGYTAGAYYSESVTIEIQLVVTTLETPKVLGSLTLGGYDQSRFVPNDQEFPFDPDDSRRTSLKVQSIVARDTLNGSATNLLDVAIYVQIDFSVTQLWLPQIVCDKFAEVFKLDFDNTNGLYTVNETVHSLLLQRKPSITIGFGTSNPAERVNVVLPYDAFDLEASYPIYDNPTKYFPIRRSTDESQYTIGRVLLQEAYMIVDHERGVFSVHQALFPATNEPRQITAIDYSASNGTQLFRQPKHLVPGAIAGIVVGIVVFAVASLLFAIVIVRRRRSTKGENGVEEPITGRDSTLYPDRQELHEDVRKPPEISGNAVHEMYDPLEREMEGKPLEQS